MRKDGLEVVKFANQINNIVNTLTGEKSGEMLVSVKLQEEAGE